MLVFLVSGSRCQDFFFISTPKLSTYDETIVKKNLCQGCLDKVTETLEGNFEEGKEDYLPFCLVDFKTLDIYPVQKTKRSYSVRDYWIELDYDDSEIELDVYYLPGNV